MHITFYKRFLTCRNRRTSKVISLMVLGISLAMFPCPIRIDFCRNPYYICVFPSVHCSMLSTNATVLGLLSWKSKGAPQWPPKEIRPYEGFISFGMVNMVWMSRWKLAKRLGSVGYVTPIYPL